MPTLGPTLQWEKSILSTKVPLVAGMDEVGRGAYGGPVTVGVCVVDVNVGAIPSGLKDSKLLTPLARERLVPAIETWSVACAVGDASAAEIDDLGMTAALRLAGMRALAALNVRPTVIALDGSFDWLTPEPAGLFDEPVDFSASVATFVKGDLKMASIAAASVIAKVHRDAVMMRLEATHPGYGWSHHMGYGTPAHRDAIKKLGLSSAHRASWKIDEESSTN